MIKKEKNENIVMKDYIHRGACGTRERKTGEIFFGSEECLR
jgi:hypothetical protein